MLASAQELTLLYIEDNHEIRENLSRFIRQNGLCVLETDNTLAACDLFRTHKIDLILTDLHLPDENGIEFVRCLRKRGVLTPVVITTAYAEKEFLLDAINLDVTRYLVKPFKKRDLLEALQTAIKKLSVSHVSAFTDLNNGYSYDPINKTITPPQNAPIQLSKKEYLLLELLLQQKGTTVPYSVIENTVWENSTMSIDALRTLVRSIRKKSYEKLITNVSGIGYRIDL